MPPNCFSCVIHVFGSQRIPNRFEKCCIYTFLAEKEHKMPPYSSYAIIQDATDDKYTWKDVIYTFQRGCKPTLYNWQLKWRFCVLGILFLWKTLIGQEKLHEGISCCVFAFSPLTLDVQENDATTICCEAPEMFCGLRNFT